MSIQSVRVYPRTFAGGSRSRVVEIRTDRLEAHRLSAPARVRARDVAHIFRAKGEAAFTAFALPPQSVRATSVPRELQQHEGETYLTLRAALCGWLARTTATQRYAALRSHGGDIGSFLHVLRKKGMIATAGPAGAGKSHGPTAAAGIDGPADAGESDGFAIPVGSLGYLRQVGYHLPGSLVVNTHFFLLDLRELDSPFAAIGDPIGMLATNGQIRNPPVLPRATLVQAGGKWQVRRLGVDDLEIVLADGTVVHPKAAEASKQARTPTGLEAARAVGIPRASGTSRPSETSQPLEDPGASDCYYRGREPHGERTPDSESAFEVCIQGRYASLVRTGGGFVPPHGALVVSFASPPKPETLQALTAQPRVRFRIPALPDLSTALQVGPELLRDGEIVVGEASFHGEVFRTLGDPNPTAPLVFPADHDRTQAGRVGIGVTRENTLVILAVEGTSSLSAPASAGGAVQPTGCTLSELAQALLEAGAVDALNFDGGGSTQVFSGAGAVLGSTDSRLVPGASFDRPVPVAASTT